MKEMLKQIDAAIKDKYDSLKAVDMSATKIEDVHRQLRFEHPELAEYVRKKMLEMGKKSGDLP